MSQPSTATVKRLFAVSGNICAFPKCTNPLVVEGKVIGKVCHIKAKNVGGPRYDKDQSENDRNGFDNLVIMCPIHHDVIDSDEESYSVDRLIDIKTAHEAKSHSKLDIDEDTAGKFLVNVSRLEGGSVIINTGQSGGQVAHQIINNKPPQRTISHAQELDLLNLLKQIPKETCKVLIPTGDSEAENFARRIVIILENAGWSVNELFLQSFGPSQNGIRLSIPNHSNITLEYLGGWFRDNGFKIVANNNEKNGNGNQIWIGSNLD